MKNTFAFNSRFIQKYVKYFDLYENEEKIPRLFASKYIIMRKRNMGKDFVTLRKIADFNMKLLVLPVNNEISLVFLKYAFYGPFNIQTLFKFLPKTM